MKDILLCGCMGRMGKAVQSCVEQRSDCRITAGLDLNPAQFTSSYPVYASVHEMQGRADVIIDFSIPNAISELLDYAVANKVPVVVCTTGHNQAQTALIEQAAECIPVFFSANMSLGVSLLRELAMKAAQVLGGSFDIEIIEKHHNQKVDAPSGTALMLADAISAQLPRKPDYVYNRPDKREKRTQNEIGIHALRGGTITGEHEIVFAGHDEVLTLSHSASSKEIFAAGAVNAALFLTSRKPRLYQMADLVK